MAIDPNDIQPISPDLQAAALASLSTEDEDVLPDEILEPVEEDSDSEEVELSQNSPTEDEAGDEEEQPNLPPFIPEDSVETESEEEDQPEEESEPQTEPEEEQKQEKQGEEGQSEKPSEPEEKQKEEQSGEEQPKPEPSSAPTRPDEPYSNGPDVPYVADPNQAQRSPQAYGNARAGDAPGSEKFFQPGVQPKDAPQTTGSTAKTPDKNPNNAPESSRDSPPTPREKTGFDEGLDKVGNKLGKANQAISKVAGEDNVASKAVDAVQKVQQVKKMTENAIELGEVVASGGFNVIADAKLLFNNRKLLLKVGKYAAIILLFVAISVVAAVLGVVSQNNLQGEPVPGASQVPSPDGNDLPLTFNPSFIMSDYLMLNKDTMTEEAIQAFLQEHKSPLANTDPSFLAKLGKNTDGSPNNQTAAHLIYQASRSGSGKGKDGKVLPISVNPEFILVKMATEQSLISPSSSTDGRLQYHLDHALSMGCPDNSACDSTIASFTQQVTLFTSYITTSWYNISIGKPTSPQWAWKSFHATIANRGGSPSDGVGTQPDRPAISHNVTMTNVATAVLYQYTPYTYIGNYNVWKTFVSYFQADVAATSRSNTAVTMTGVGEDPKNPGGSSTGTTTATIADCQQLVSSNKIRVWNPADKQGLLTGSFTHKDGTVTLLDPKVCGILKLLVDNNVAPILVTAVAALEPYHDTTSRQYNGHGVNIQEEAIGSATPPTTGTGGVVMKWISDHQDLLKSKGLVPSQLVGPQSSVITGENDTQWAFNNGKSQPGFFVSGANNHIHIGY